jgi:peroxiredoxin
VTLAGTALREGRVVPAVSFRDATSDSKVDLSRFRQRTALVLAFLHDRCDTCRGFAQELRTIEDDLDWAGAVARAVVSDDEDLPIPVFVDRGRRATRKLLGDDAYVPVIVIVDRYGAATSAFVATDHGFPKKGEVAATVTHLALQCPECGVSDWPDVDEDDEG